MYTIMPGSIRKRQVIRVMATTQTTLVKRVWLDGLDGSLQNFVLWEVNVHLLVDALIDVVDFIVIVPAIHDREALLLVTQVTVTSTGAHMVAPRFCHSPLDRIPPLVLI